jgi:hypothetical protein
MIGTLPLAWIPAFAGMTHEMDGYGLRGIVDAVPL